MCVALRVARASPAGRVSLCPDNVRVRSVSAQQLLYTEPLEDDLMADNNGSANLAWFLVGAALGATAALLLAPQTGTETREYIRRRTEKGRGKLAESGREALERGREYYDRGKEIADDAAELFEKGQQALGRAKSAAGPSEGSGGASEASG